MTKLYGRVCVIVLLLTSYTLAIQNARHASITVDEGLHIASGYTILVTGDYRLVEEHPPITKLWMALPLLPLSDLPNPTTLPAWDTSAYKQSESIPLLRIAQQLLYPHTPIQQWLFPPRLMCILLGVLVLSLLHRWAQDLWGMPGGLLVIGLAALDPNIIAHSAIAGTDIGATFLILTTLWIGGRFFTKPRTHLVLLTGLTMGMALASKLTAILVIIPFGLIWILKYLKSKRDQRKKTFRNGSLVFIVAFFTLWSIYSFQLGQVPGLSIPVPMPAHVTPFLRLFQHAGEGHQAFLFGENSLSGWWYYFPLAFLVKTPFAVLLLFTLAFVSSFGKRYLRNSHFITAILFLIVYTGATLASPINIGYRHILPSLCIVYIWLGGYFKVRKKWKLVVCSLLFLYQAVNTVRYTPYLVGWFNNISGGPLNGWRYLADSNTDWGQGFQALSQYEKDNHIKSFQLAAFIFYDPAIYNLTYNPLTPMHGNTPAVFPSRFAPAPGHYAISKTALDGIPLADNEMYDWFRWREPDAHIANAIHYYDVKGDETTTNWIAQCIKPVAPLSPEDIDLGFGDREWRRYIPMDCTQSWIIPHSPDGYGVYIIHGELIKNSLLSKLHYTQPLSNDQFINEHLQTTLITYQQRKYLYNPAFSVYRQRSAASPVIPQALEVWPAPADSPPLLDVNQVTVSTPIEFNGPLDFLGARLIPEGDAYEVETWWQVNWIPEDSKAPSIMAHLLNDRGENISVADGLGILPSTWLPDDVIIQRHRFPVSDLTPKNTILLRTGVYWLDTGERMVLTRDPGIDALYVQLNK